MFRINDKDFKIVIKKREDLKANRITLSGKMIEMVIIRKPYLKACVVLGGTAVIQRNEWVNESKPSQVFCIN